MIMLRAKGLFLQFYTSDYDRLSLAVMRRLNFSIMQPDPCLLAAVSGTD